jgi:NADPH:quinone reductase-like Zn-dependent oxidoreductase
MPSKNRAIVKQKPGQAIITNVPVPPLRPGYMLVRTHAVALNPADWTDVDYSGYYGCIVGVDYAGVVVEVGGQTVRSFKTGDRVAGSAHGCNTLQPSDGAFAQYILVKTDMQIHIPDSMSFEEAASLGVGILTSGMGLFHEMGLPPPADPPSEENFSSSATENSSWILIYGGSSATGSIAIQLAKLQVTS